MTMKDYMRYLDVQQDEDPLYIFDSGFGERAPDMLKVSFKIYYIIYILVVILLL